MADLTFETLAYNPSDPGYTFDIYDGKFTSYPIEGPPIFGTKSYLPLLKSSHDYLTLYSNRPHFKLPSFKRDHHNGIKRDPDQHQHYNLRVCLWYSNPVSPGVPPSLAGTCPAT